MRSLGEHRVQHLHIALEKLSSCEHADSSYQGRVWKAAFRQCHQLEEDMNQYEKMLPTVI